MRPEKRELFISGGSRAFGLAMVVRAARDEARFVTAVENAKSHTTPDHTISSAEDKLEKSGGKALSIALGVRHASSADAAIKAAAAHFSRSQEIPVRRSEQWQRIRYCQTSSYWRSFPART